MKLCIHGDVILAQVMGLIAKAAAKRALYV